MQPLLDWRDGLGNPVVVFECADVLVKVSGSAGATTERMDLRSGQTIEIVELHRTQRRAQIYEFLWWFVQLSAFVIGTDDEDSHIPSAGCLNRRPVEVVHEIPVNV